MSQQSEYQQIIDKLFKPAVDDADPWVTYKMADGSLVWGEYEWVANLNFFETSDEPVELIRETWVCIGRETITVNVRPPSCPNCGEELPAKVDDDESPMPFCSEACWLEDRASTMADKARDEAKFDDQQEDRRDFERHMP